MANYYHSPVVGIDVAANFSVATALKPDGTVFKKNLNIEHNKNGFDKLLNFIKKIEEEFNSAPAVFCESTGIYHLTLLQFLIKHQVEIHVVNPLITNSNKNWNIRKAKTDKLDSYSIAKLCKSGDIKTSCILTEEFLHLRFLVREYYQISDNASELKIKFSNSIYIHYPGLQFAFADLTGKTPLAFLEVYPTPNHLLNAPKDEVIIFLRESSRRGLEWAQNKYSKLLGIAEDANNIGINPNLFENKIKRFSETYCFLKEQLESLFDEINDYISNATFADSFKLNYNLLMSFKGIGPMTAITLLTEIGDIKNFSNAQKLVAFFGVDPSVNESGNFKGDKNKMSKRGTSLGRRVLYTLAMASIRKSKSGTANNKILHHYYTVQLGTKKKKKVRLVAVMNKLLRYIFSVLKNQKPYEQRDPRIHKKMFLESQCLNQLAA
ncbi:IS110 family transposase [Candidatus Woesearchaeota archaeon]|nr:IS110 family transposase [Candidatus Woesearchaeota archaeon]